MYHRQVDGADEKILSSQDDVRPGELFGEGFRGFERFCGAQAQHFLCVKALRAEQVRMTLERAGFQVCEEAAAILQQDLEPARGLRIGAKTEELIEREDAPAPGRPHGKRDGSFPGKGKAVSIDQVDESARAGRRRFLSRPRGWHPRT